MRRFAGTDESVLSPRLPSEGYASGTSDREKLSLPLLVGTSFAVVVTVRMCEKEKGKEKEREEPASIHVLFIRMDNN